jgi:hypothetical protein
VASTVNARNPAWADGVTVSGAEMRAAIMGTLWTGAGIVRGLATVQIPTPAMKVRVPAGLCMVSDGQNGFIPLELAAQTDLDIGASSPTLPRIDSLIAEFVDAGGSSIYRYRIVAGTPNASPVQPTLPYADQPSGKTLRLYNIAVAALATTIVDANITKQATTTQLTSSTSTPSEEIWRADKQCKELWTGSQWVEDYVGTVGPAWKTWTPTWSGSTTNPVLGNGTMTGRYTKTGRTVQYVIEVTMGSTTTYGSGAYGWTLPVTPGFDATGNAILVDTSATLRYAATAWITPAAGVFRVIPPADAGNVGIAGTVPFTFASTDQIIISGTYEAAS